MFVHLFCLTNLFLLYVSMVTLVMTYTETTIEFLSWDFMVLAKDWCKTLVLKLMASFKESWRQLVKFKCSQCSDFPSSEGNQYVQRILKYIAVAVIQNKYTYCVLKQTKN